MTPGTGGDTPRVWLGLSGSSRAGLGSGYSGLEAALLGFIGACIGLGLGLGLGFRVRISG